MKIKFLLALLLLSTAAYNRKPPVSFPPKYGIDPNMLSELEKNLDQTVFPVVSFIDAPVSRVISWAFQDIKKPAGGIVYVKNYITPNDMVLASSPETVTLNLTNVTCRNLLDAACYEAHLSWRLEPTYPTRSPRIKVARPEIFLEVLEIEKRNYKIESWMPILFLIAIVGMFLFFPLIFSLFPLSAQTNLASKFLGRKYRHLLEPSLKGYVANLTAGSVLPVPLDIILGTRLWYLMLKDRKAAVKYVYCILVAMGNKVPKDAWREFYKRNPEAQGLKCPVNLDS